MATIMMPCHPTMIAAPGAWSNFSKWFKAANVSPLQCVKQVPTA